MSSRMSWILWLAVEPLLGTIFLVLALWMQGQGFLAWPTFVAAGVLYGAGLQLGLYSYLLKRSLRRELANSLEDLRRS